MPAFHVEASTTIKANAATIHKTLANFNEWPVWSPWLYMEREAQIDYRGQPGQVSHGYDWKGKMVGAGGMTLTHSDTSELKMDLEFLKPFKSKAKVRFEIAGTDTDSDSTPESRVTWHMDSSLPFFMFFMVGTMTSMIRMDYQRGLKMLREYIETGSVKSKTEVVGVVDVPQSSYIGLTTDSTMDALGESMSKTLPTVYQAATTNNLEMSGPVMAIYNRMNMKAQNCTYTSAIPVDTTSSIEAPVHIGQIQEGKALKVIHTGSYEHLGNAWATAIGNQRFQKLKPSKQQAPFEIYISDPEDTAPEDLITEVYVPVR